MPAVGVIFELRRAETRPGEAICICGSHKETGCWDATAELTTNLQLRTSDSEYPRWYLRSPVWFSFERKLQAGISTPSFSLEYKYIRDRKALDIQGPRYRWEDSSSNRKVIIPYEDGSIFIVSDSCWNDADVPAVVKRWLAPIQPGKAPQTVGKQIVPNLNLAGPPGEIFVPMTPRGQTFVSYILSPRRKEADNFEIETEFNALDSARTTADCTCYNQELEALRRENMMLRQRLHMYEKEMLEDTESVISSYESGNSSLEDGAMSECSQR